MKYEQIVRDQHYYLEDISSSLHRDLEAEEYSALKRVLERIVRVPSPKLIDLNIPFWLIKRFYIQIYIGEDKRSSQRNERDEYEREKLKEYKERDAGYYLANLPDTILEGLNYEDKQVILAVFARAITIPSQKIIETNLRFKLKRRYYLAFYLGFDRRKGRRDSKNALMDRLSVLGSLLIYLIVILFVVYFAKTVLNYDIIKGIHGIDYLIEKLGLNQ